MSAANDLRSFFGFALQLVPCAMLLLIPFQDRAFPAGRRKAFALLVLLSLGFSLCYPLHVRWNARLSVNSNLDDNLYMLLAIACVTALFIRITRESLSRKFAVLFLVFSYAAVQFFLANMLMDYLPLKKQDMTYNDATLAAYLIVTAVLLPPVAFFMRSRINKYLSTLEDAAHSRLEFVFLAAILALYLILNLLYSALWIRLRDAFQLSSVYYIPCSLFLTGLLIFTFYCTINLSIFKARNAEQELELALMRQDHKHIEESIRQQKRALHDMRQLLRSISSLAKDGTREDLLKYLDETMEYTAASDRRFCVNPCVNGLLSYYAELAESQGIGFSARAVCDRLPFSDADLTILLGNALDNAVRAAAEYGEAQPGSRWEIRFTADTVNDQFAILIENPCLCVNYAPDYPHPAERRGWLPAGAFLSTHGGGYGLRRMEMIAEKYDGHAWFSFDADACLFAARLMMPVREV